MQTENDEKKITDNDGKKMQTENDGKKVADLNAKKTKRLIEIQVLTKYFT